MRKFYARLALIAQRVRWTALEANDAVTRVDGNTLRGFGRREEAAGGKELALSLGALART